MFISVIKNKWILLAVTLILFTASTIAQVEIHKNLPNIILSGTNGGNIDGSDWTNTDLTNKINLIYYVSPSQQKVVEPLLEKIDKNNYPVEELSTTIIINTKATWIPNSVIVGKVKGRAKEDTTKNYVLDKKEILLKEWELSEDNPNILLINGKGEVVFLHTDELTKEIENKLINQIELQINKGESK
ncbi:protein ytfj precursor [hydrocarbon metagenome]|uniref:Protein ytfj n=1 Tax=hydrocarbon metagenome TaxID=938273 RepID=A0A0W8FVS2_9ZZZZ